LERAESEPRAGLEFTQIDGLVEGSGTIESQHGIELAGSCVDGKRRRRVVDESAGSQQCIQIDTVVGMSVCDVNGVDLVSVDMLY
jgi:hypothetical protein